MESSPKTIDKIKYTISEIKDDIQKMKTVMNFQQKNEKALNSMMQSMNLTSEMANKINIIEEGTEQGNSQSNPSISDAQKDEMNRKKEQNKSAQEEASPQSVSSQNIYENQQNEIDEQTTLEKKEEDIILNSKENAGNNQMKMLIKYENDVEEMKKTIKELMQEKGILNEKLEEQQKKKEQLLRKKKESENDNTELVRNLGTIIDCSSPEETLNTITEMHNYLNNNDCQLRHEFVDKLKNLYITLVGEESEEKQNKLNTQILWKWIIYLIQTLQSLSQQREQILQDYKELQQSDLKYEQYFEELIKELHLKNIQDLKKFINELLSLHTLNRKRINKLKKVLLNKNSITNEDGNEI